MADIVGTPGSDALWGGFAADVMLGGDGGDQLMGGGGADLIRGEGGNDNLDGESGSDTLYGGAGDDALSQGFEIQNDRLYGEDGNDSLNVEAFVSSPPGSAYLDGGAGNDSLRMSGGPGLTVTALAGAGADRATVIGLVNGSLDLGADNDELTLLWSRGALSLTLGTGADTIKFFRTVGTGPEGLVTVADFNPAEDRLLAGDPAGLQFSNWSGDNPFVTGHLQLVQSGSAVLLRADWDGGADGYIDLFRFENLQVVQLSALSLFGYPASGGQTAGVTLTGGAGADRLEGGFGDDSISGVDGNDTLSGGSGADTVEGGAGADIIYGQAGRDVLRGGDGNDTIGGSANAQVFGDAGDDDLGMSFDGGAGSAFLDGGAGNDRLYAYFTQPSAATLYGGDGADTLTMHSVGSASLSGGDGNDRFTLVEASGGTITMGGGVDTLAFELPSPNPESRVLSSVVVQDFQGGAGGDRIEFLDYLRNVATGWDQDTNPFASGHLRLIAVGSDTALQVNAEGVWQDLVVFRKLAPAQLSAENFGGWPPGGGAAVGSMIAGSANADTLTGGLGPDTISGGVGNDSLSGSLGPDQIVGGEGDDTLAGGTGADELRGGDGRDWIQVTAGQDTAYGGGGDDRLTGVTTGGAFFGEGGNDFVSISGDYRAPGLGFLLDLGDGDDIGWHSGSGGPATVLGGAGNDKVTISGWSSTPSTATVMAGEGNDTVTAAGPGTNFLRGEDGHDSLQGGDSFDDMHGNLGEDTLYGGRGGDWVVGGQGNDVLFGEQDGDVVYGNLGNDTVTGGDGNDWVRGGQGDDLIRGEAGDDYIAGDRGADTIYGGAGADLFHTFSGAGLDRVLDFNAAEGDRVNVLAGTTYTLREEGADTIVDMGDGDQVVLVGVQLASLPTGWIFS